MKKAYAYIATGLLLLVMASCTQQESHTDELVVLEAADNVIVIDADSALVCLEWAARHHHTRHHTDTLSVGQCQVYHNPSDSTGTHD